VARFFLIIGLVIASWLTAQYAHSQLPQPKTAPEGNGGN